MALSEHVKAAVQAKLAMGATPRELALGEFEGKISYSVIKRISRDMEAEDEKDITSINPGIIHMVVEKAKEEAPKKVVAKLEKLSEGINSLQLLDGQFHVTMGLALDKADEFLGQEDLKPSDWVAITNALSNAYNNIFNNKGVNVNVNNGTQFSDTKLNMFKGAMRG